MRLRLLWLLLLLIIRALLDSLTAEEEEKSGKGLRKGEEVGKFGVWFRRRKVRRCRYNLHLLKGNVIPKTGRKSREKKPLGAHGKSSLRNL